MHRQIPDGGDGDWRRRAVPQSRLPDLRVAGRLPRRARPALHLHPRRGPVPHRPRLRAARRRRHHARADRQRAAQSHRRRCQPGGVGVARRPGPRPRPVGAVRRSLHRHPLRRQQPLHRRIRRHGRAHGDRLHVLQEVRHDRLAAGRRGGAGTGRRHHHQDQHQRRVVHQPVRATGRRGGAAGRPERVRAYREHAAGPPRPHRRPAERHRRGDGARLRRHLLPVPGRDRRVPPARIPGRQ